MLRSLVLSKSNIFWVILHLILGVFSSISPLALIAWFYIVFFSSVEVLIKTKSVFPFLAFIAYLTSFEVLARMSGTSPFIPYELGKYLCFFILAFGIYKFNNISMVGMAMVFLLLPSIFFDLSGRVDKQSLVFNLLGPINVGMSVWFFYGKRIKLSQFVRLLRLAVLPLLSILASVIFKTPSLESIEFSLGANFSTSGGWGSNQISTIFGVGAFLVFIFLINKWKLSGYRLVDFGLFFLFGFQGLLTFSRGGVIGGALGIIIILYYIFKLSSDMRVKRRLPNVGLLVFPIIFISVFTFQIVDSLTGGLLTLRYLGETAGTLAGSKEISINSFTTGRYDIFLADANLWLDNIFWGVGAGASSFLRFGEANYLSHVELSRLLAEHGMLGLTFFILLLYVLVLVMRNRNEKLIQGILVAFYFLAIYTTFHAAMRTYLTPLFIGISLLTIVNTRSKTKPLEPNTELK